MTDSLAFIEIMLAQSALQQSGYYHGPVDGNLSKSARQALMGFQKDGGLEVTGELDDELFRRFLELRQERAYSMADDYRISETLN
jgi:peptidoglycan hydrolase-like protein with peptidoglycan-binding domain